MTKINIKRSPYSQSTSLEKPSENSPGGLFRKNPGIIMADMKMGRKLRAMIDKQCGIYLKTKSKNMFTVQRAPYLSPLWQGDRPAAKCS